MFLCPIIDPPPFSPPRAPDTNKQKVWFSYEGTLGDLVSTATDITEMPERIKSGEDFATKLKDLMQGLTRSEKTKRILQLVWKM